MPVSAVRNRLPKEWPRRPPPFGKRYWKRRVSRSSSGARAAMQLRMSPGGSTPNSRRSRPDEPPSSVTVTTPVSWRSRSVPTWCLRPRRRAERPVPPPIATRARSGSGDAKEGAEVAVLAELGEIGIVEGMDAILGAQLDRPGQRLRRLVPPALDGVERGRQIGETLVLLVAPALAADLQRLLEVAPVLLVDGLEVGVRLGALRRRLLTLRLLAARRQVLAGPVPHLRPGALADRLLEPLDGLRPVLRLEGGEALGEGVEGGIGPRGWRRLGALDGRGGLGFGFLWSLLGGLGHGSLSLAFLQLDQDLLRDRLQGIEDADARRRHRLEGRLALVVERAIHLFDRYHAREIPLVELQGVGDRRQVEPVLLQVLFQVADRLDVRLHPLLLAVGHEDHAVDPLEDQLAAGVVEHLAGDGVEVEAGGEAADAPEVERQEVEEERAVGFGRQGDHLALRLGGGLVVDVLQIGRLPAQAGPVVDDLAVDLFAGVIDKSHRRLPCLVPSPGPSLRAGAVRRECLDLRRRSAGGRRALPSFAGYSPNRASMSSSVISEKGLAWIDPCAPLSPFCSITSKIFSSSTLARLTRRRTRPSEDRSSKMTTRMARLATMEMWMWSC